MACKVDSKLVKNWIEDTGADAEKKMHAERMRYAVQKDELVMNVSQKMIQPAENVAYPLIISNLSELDVDTKLILYALYASETYDEFMNGKKMLNTHAHQREQRLSPDLQTYIQKAIDTSVDTAKNSSVGYFPFFKAQGYAQGTGFASHISGDTVCTVTIGGMLSVMNGHFTMHTGDLVQWYFSGEEAYFCPDTTSSNLSGERCRERSTDNTNKRRKTYHDQRAFGMQPINTKHKSMAVFRIKPYRMSKTRDGEEYVDFYGDKSRVFAKCIGGAKPYEMVDIMLMTQSL